MRGKTRLRKTSRWVVASLLLVFTATAAGQGTPDTIRAVIDVTKTGEPINPLMWGHFIENLGNWFEGGMWAEMIGDRKFFYPVDNDETQSPPNSGRTWVNRWTTVGPATSVVMDSARAFVGTHSPRIALAGSDPRGIRQSGIPVHARQNYTGRVFLAGDRSARVSVSLVWGQNPLDRHTVTIANLSQEFRKYPLSFTSQSDNPTAQLEVTGTGSGSFLIGAVSLMQADHVEGFRPEILALLSEMKITTTRWAGNFSANYDWRDGIGDPDTRPPRYDFAWRALEPNDVGTFEVLALNRLLGSEPNIGVNAGLGDAYSAAQWVEYVNGSVKTPMGQLRAKHGHPEPFNVKWWGIGNEMYGEWQIGHMAIDDYVIKHNKFAEAMRAVDPSIILVASGASLYQMHADSRTRKRLDLPPYAYESLYDWSGNLLKDAWRNMDYISEHIYGPYGLKAQYYDLAAQRWVPDADAPIQDRLRRIPNRARGAVDVWEEYHRRMPWLKDTKIRLVMDEWSTGGGDMSAGLTVAMTLNEMFRHTDVYVMSMHTCAPCALNYNRFDKPVMRSNGLVFKLLANRFGTLPVLDIGGNSAQPVLRGTVGVDVPEVSSGSPTYPLDVMAALSSDRRRLTVTVVNPSEGRQQLQLEVKGTTLPANGRKWTVSGPTIDSRNVAGQAQQIEWIESALSNATAPMAVPPLSINLYELEIR